MQSVSSSSPLQSTVLERDRLVCISGISIKKGQSNPINT